MGPQAGLILQTTGRSVLVQLRIQLSPIPAAGLPGGPVQPLEHRYRRGEDGRDSDDDAAFAEPREEPLLLGSGRGLHDGQITIRCSPASRVLVTGGIPGKQVQAGDALTECTLSPEMFQASAYIRVTVIDTNDHRAWSNPIWLN